ncbi:rRNA-binding ribosome biosynthesis protein rpf2 [Cichlidogyrus casuarinus]|uniref:Ribosome production factor 2 homolog n=1 Tax=Cichlidogyrus casuarinus TaxID=1844966 RepID=A0ABD2Q788_9PLAT
MSSLKHRINKPKTRRGKKFLEDRAPKVHENDKKVLVFRGSHTNDIINDFLKTFCSLKAPLFTKLKNKNPVLPFDSTSFIEHMGRKYDCSLFLCGMHSKKRPHNIVIGRTFDGEVLDMFELGIENYRGFDNQHGFHLPAGAKPMLLFSGEAFTDDEPIIELKSLLIDLFRGPKIPSVSTYGTDLQIHFVASSSTEIKMRVRAIKFEKPEQGEEHVIQKPDGTLVTCKLIDVGPTIDFVCRRHRLAPVDKMKAALRVPKVTYNAKRGPKNVSQDEFGTKTGTIHLSRDDNAMDELRPGKSIRTALTGKRKRGFDTHSTMKQQKEKRIKTMDFNVDS